MEKDLKIAAVIFGAVFLLGIVALAASLATTELKNVVVGAIKAA